MVIHFNCSELDCCLILEAKEAALPLLSLFSGKNAEEAFLILPILFI